MKKQYLNDKLRRTEILARVMNGEKVTKRDATLEYGVEEVTITRDLIALREAGIPIYGAKHGIIIQGKIDNAQLSKIASEYIPVKLQSDLMFRQVKPSIVQRQNFFQYLILLSKAIDERKVIHIKYNRLTDDEVHEYELQPLHLNNHDLNWVLFASKRDSETVQTFYLSRIESLRLTQKTFPKRISEKESAKNYDMVFKFESSVANSVLDKIWFENYKIEETRNNALCLSTRQPITNKLASWCISWWDKMEIIQPIELKEHISEMFCSFADKNKLET